MIYVCNICLEADKKKTLRGDVIKKSGMLFYKKSSKIKSCAQCDIWHKDRSFVTGFHNFDDYDRVLKQVLIIKKLRGS